MPGSSSVSSHRRSASVGANNKNNSNNKPSLALFYQDDDAPQIRKTRSQLQKEKKQRQGSVQDSLRSFLDDCTHTDLLDDLPTSGLDVLGSPKKAARKKDALSLSDHGGHPRIRRRPPNRARSDPLGASSEHVPKSSGASLYSSTHKKERPVSRGKLKATTSMSSAGTCSLESIDEGSWEGGSFAGSDNVQPSFEEQPSRRRRLKKKKKSKSLPAKKTQELPTEEDDKPKKGSLDAAMAKNEQKYRHRRQTSASVTDGGGSVMSGASSRRRRARSLMVQGSGSQSVSGGGSVHSFTRSSSIGRRRSSLLQGLPSNHNNQELLSSSSSHHRRRRGSGLSASLHDKSGITTSSRSSHSRRTSLGLEGVNNNSSSHGRRPRRRSSSLGKYSNHHHQQPGAVESVVSGTASVSQAYGYNQPAAAASQQQEGRPRRRRSSSASAVRRKSSFGSRQHDGNDDDDNVSQISDLPSDIDDEDDDEWLQERASRQDAILTEANQQRWEREEKVYEEEKRQMQMGSDSNLEGEDLEEDFDDDQPRTKSKNEKPWKQLTKAVTKTGRVTRSAAKGSVNAIRDPKRAAKNVGNLSKSVAKGTAKVVLDPTKAAKRVGGFTKDVGLGTVKFGTGITVGVAQGTLKGTKHVVRGGFNTTTMVVGKTAQGVGTVVVGATNLIIRREEADKDEYDDYDAKALSSRRVTSSSLMDRISKVVDDEEVSSSELKLTSPEKRAKSKKQTKKMKLPPPRPMKGSSILVPPVAADLSQESWDIS